MGLEEKGGLDWVELREVSRMDWVKQRRGGRIGWRGEGWDGLG